MVMVRLSSRQILKVLPKFYKILSHREIWHVCIFLFLEFVCVEVLWSSQPNRACRVWSVYLTTCLLGR